jgi:hypothetical protein
MVSGPSSSFPTASARLVLPVQERLHARANTSAQPTMAITKVRRRRASVRL